MSATHSWSIPVGVISPARFGYTRRVWLESVVITNFRFRMHSRLSCLSNRRTRLAFTLQPRRRSSAVMRGRP